MDETFAVEHVSGNITLAEEETAVHIKVQEVLKKGVRAWI